MNNVSIPCVGPEVDQLILDFHSCNIKTRGTVVALYFEVEALYDSVVGGELREGQGFQERSNPR